MNIVEYFQQLKTVIIVSPFISSWDYQEDARTHVEGFFKAKIYFIDGSFLEFREYVNVSKRIVKKFRYPLNI